jgi:hypothetical protein
MRLRAFPATWPAVGCFTAVFIAISGSVAQADCALNLGSSAAQARWGGDVNNPRLILQQNPQGGGLMISRIRYVAVNPAALSTIIGMVEEANNLQQYAIGVGLGQAQKFCTRWDREYADRIREQVFTAKKSDLIRGFLQGASENYAGG